MKGKKVTKVKKVTKAKKVKKAARATTTRKRSPTGGSGTRRATRRGDSRAEGSVDPFDRVVVLMLENRSFDHLLGALRLAVPGLDGLPETPPWRVNRTATATYEQKP